MNRILVSDVVVGNDFVVPQRQRSITEPAVEKTPVFAMPASIPVLAAPAVAESIPVSQTTHASAAHKRTPWWQRAFDTMHDHSVITFSLLILAVGSAGITVFGQYEAAAIEATARPSIAARVKAPAIAGFNVTVPAGQLDAKLQSVTSQSAILTVGDQPEAISPDIIKSWLQITPSADKSASGIHVSTATIVKTVTELAKKHEKAPLNQVSVTYADGSSAVISPGRDGSSLSDPDGIKTQALSIAKTLLDARGFAFNTPLKTEAFQNVTPANFDKLIEVNVDTKQMYLYQNGQLYKTYAISAGAPATPTPIGQYKTFSKLAVQDMRGFNPNGTPYFQPHVRWISYFLPGGYAIHGNYWRPQSWFGAVNSSHGCVSLPDDQAKEVFDWAPVGTTIITHHS